MQPVIHGIFSLTTPTENRVRFEDAVYAVREHYNEVMNESPAYPPIADGAPTVIDEAGGLEYKTTDEFWLYQVDIEFWKKLAGEYPEISISLFYGSIFEGEDCGMFTSDNGRISDVRYEKGSPDALEFSRSLNGMDGLYEEES